jgi:hypothetical protein
MKNRIINGAMVIDQRNAGASIGTASGTSTYTLDRWLAVFTQNSKFTLQQNAGSVTPPVGFANYIGITTTSAYTGSGDIFNIGQNIEGFNFDLGWGTANAKTITISFWVRSSLTGTFGGALQNSALNRSYPFTFTISVADTWEYKTITVAGDTSGTWVGATNGIGLRLWVNLGCGSTYSGTAGAWASADYRSATGATSVIANASATLYLTGVQLEVGSTATSFDYRPYTTELQLCQRYLPAFRATASTYDYLAPVFSAGGTGLWVTFQFLVTARVPPTGITSSAMSTFLAVVAGTGYAPTAATLTSAVSRTGAMVEFTNGSPPSAGLGGFFRFDNSGNGYIYFTGCEL